MTGGIGNDVFDFNAGDLGDLDVITDFTKGSDLLDISGLLVGYDNIFDHFVSFTKVGTSTEVYVDSDGLVGGTTSTLLATLLNVQLTSADSASFIVETV